MIDISPVHQSRAELPRHTLFRPESFEERQLAWLGRHTLALGLPAKATGAVSFVMALATVALAAYSGYARRVEVHGVVLPAAGLVQVTAPVTGRIESSNVQDGQAVKSGTPLYVINTDTSTKAGGTQQQILDMLASQRAVQIQEISRKVVLRQQHDALVRQRIDNLKAQIREAAVQVQMKDEFVRKLTGDLADYTRLLETGIGNMNERQIQQQNWMRAKDELEQLKSGSLKLQAQLIEAESEQASSDLQADNEIDTMRARISDIDQQAANARARRSVEVRAPADGVVTAVVSHPGQIVASSTRMLTIVPSNQKMQAELLAPSTAIGFIHPGQRVWLRYSAFPYQKFGQYGGTVTDVSRAALAPDELRSFVPAPQPADQSRTFYRVVVAPDRQDVTTYGHREPLQPSMQVDARVLLEERPIYQWILEPLYVHGGLGRR